MPAVDTLRLKTRLSESGMPESQAQVLVEELDDALSTAISREAATKADVVELRAAIHNLDERLTEFKADVNKQFDELKTDVSKQFDELKTDVSKQFNELKADTDGRFGEVKATITSMQSDIGDLKSETRLLRWMLSAALPILAAIAIRLFFM